MKKIIYTLLLLLILAAVVSVLVNYRRKQTELRLLNLTAYNDPLIITINDYKIPYELPYGMSSEYFILTHGRSTKNIHISIDSSTTEDIPNIGFSVDSLNTVILYGNDSKVDYFPATTPKVINKGMSGVRVFKDPFFEDKITVTISNASMSDRVFAGEEKASSYEFLEEGFYSLMVERGGEKFYYRSYFEKGELYSLLILIDPNNEAPTIRLIVDNLPGDQYVSPSRQTNPQIIQ
jgi:hypothetical protein